MNEPILIRGGVKITTIFCTFFFPTKLVEVFVIVVNTHVEKLEEHVTPKPIPSIIPQIGVGVEINLINTIKHASKVFKILDIVLKDTPVSEKLEFELVPLVEHVDITCDQKLIDTTCDYKLIDIIGEKPIDDLTASVEHVVFND
jgi:hypothetical protein